jgi:uncharacterized membrane protein
MIKSIVKLFKKIPAELIFGLGSVVNYSNGNSKLGFSLAILTALFLVSRIFKVK